MKATLVSRKGFTLIELMIVVTIVGILASVAILSYRHFTKKAQSVEAEVALTEIHRLQQIYHAQHGAYGADLDAIGFTQFPPLKFYSIGMRFFGGTDGVSYQVLAHAKDPAEGSASFVMTQYQDGRMAVDKSFGSGNVSAPGIVVGGSGASPGLGSSAGAQSAGGGETDTDPFSSSTAGSTAASGGGSRTVIHTNQLTGSK